MNAPLQSSKTVPWKDLLPLTKREIANELLLSLPWLLASLYFYSRGWFFPALFCSFYFFLTGLRQSHGAQHFSIGISRSGHHLLLFLLSGLMLGSMHAVQTSHLHHHRHCLGEEDHEGSVAHLSWWRALLAGPMFVVEMHRAAWRIATRTNRRWIAAEIGMIIVLIIYAATPWAHPALGCHIAAMLVGECFTAFFAVWIVHHDNPDRMGRTQRGKWINRLTYNMFFHREHHLYPLVPTAHLDQLAVRLDEAEHPTHLEVLPRTPVLQVQPKSAFRQNTVPCNLSI